MSPLWLIGGGGHPFLDRPFGHISAVNPASVRDLAERLDKSLGPSRFRTNLYVEGWPPRAENDWTGRRMDLGAVQTEVFKRIVRCAAPAVDPSCQGTGEVSAFSISAIVSFRPKIAAKEPKRGPWVWPSSTS